MTVRIWPTIADAVTNAAHTAQAPLTWDPTNHLLSRFAFGPTPASSADVTANGPAAWYTAQVALGRQKVGYGGVAELKAMGTLLGMNPYDLTVFLTSKGSQYGWDAMDQLSDVTVGLQAFSPAQLYESLVDFFSNHLNVPNHNGDVWSTRSSYDRDAIRPFAMTNFTAMLLASSKQPAMLSYLSLMASTKNTINENYAREVLELHTVGLRYSEADVRTVARMLTGRTLDTYGHYTFDPYIHATGSISVLGFTHDNASPDGEAAGDAMLTYLAKHPYTAQNIAQKLCVRFVSDNPSATLVTAVAKAYLNSNTQILPMVSVILRSDEFWASRGMKVRRPRENIIASIRTLGLSVTDWPKATQTLRWMTAAVDDRTLDWPAPNGYPDVARAWRSGGSLLDLWNYHMAFTGGWAAGFTACDLSVLYGGPAPATSGAAIAVLTKQLTGVTWSAEHLAALQTFLGEPAEALMSNSKLRWMTATVLGLILDAPHHALR